MVSPIPFSRRESGCAAAMSPFPDIGDGYNCARTRRLCHVYDALAGSDDEEENHAAREAPIARASSAEVRRPAAEDEQATWPAAGVEDPLGLFTPHAAMDDEAVAAEGGLKSRPQPLGAAEEAALLARVAEVLAQTSGTQQEPPSARNTVTEVVHGGSGGYEI